MPTARQAYIYRAHKRNIIFANFKKFANDILSPFDATASLYPMRANARIGVSHSVGVASGQLRVLVDNRILKTSLLTANQIYRLEIIERNKELDLESDVAGTISLYVYNEWMQPFVVATAVV